MTALALLALATPFFKIQVVDAGTGRGVPLVELRTVNNLVFVTDSNGLVAFNEPGLMDRKVYFHVRSHGYELPKDGFGYRGVALTPRAGGSETIRLPRLNIAERIARLTGSGIYRDSHLLGEKAPKLEERLLGQDTAQAEIYRGRMMWFWGDTDRASYPLGNFHTTGAVATIPSGGAENGIRYRYFGDKDGFVREMVSSNEPGPIWVSGLVVLGKGQDEKLFAYYARMKSLGEISESGLLRWNDGREAFDMVQKFDKAREWRFLDGHTLRDGAHQLGNLPPNVRVPADEKSLLDESAYEAFTCLNADGSVGSYRWQKALPPITPAAEAKLVADGKLKPEQVHFLPKDAAGETITPHGGSVHWNAHRKRWIMIFTRVGGKDSHLGEIYYSEAEAPTGPFRRAVKIATHDRYTFYNPVHHAFLDEDGGRTIFFEGTYTAEFSGNPEKTPLYNYNQVLYRLDLDDARLTFARQ
ncbi:hypothetical protein EON82_19550 [bacterium]|nr:MAG: hypothetical protein EON82_19550 [bacterium]